MTRIHTRNGYVLMIDWCPIARTTTAFVFEDTPSNLLVMFPRKKGIIIHAWKNRSIGEEEDITKSKRIFQSLIEEDGLKNRLLAMRMK